VRSENTDAFFPAEEEGKIKDMEPQKLPVHERRHPEDVRPGEQNRLPAHDGYKRYASDGGLLEVLAPMV